MNNTVPVSNLFDTRLKIVSSNLQNENEKLTPYLRAILSATPTPVNAEKKALLSTPDLYAALRYIKESGLIRK